MIIQPKISSNNKNILYRYSWLKKLVIVDRSKKEKKRNELGLALGRKNSRKR